MGQGLGAMLVGNALTRCVATVNRKAFAPSSVVTSRSIASTSTWCRHTIGTSSTSDGVAFIHSPR